MVYIVDRPFQRSFVTLNDCLFLVAMTTMCIFLYKTWHACYRSFHCMTVQVGTSGYKWFYVVKSGAM